MKALDGSIKNHIHALSKTYHLGKETGLEGGLIDSKCRRETHL